MTHSCIAVLLSLLGGCAQPLCSASGGTWSDCAVEQAWCVDGEVQTGDQLTMCEDGCTCPSEAPVWDHEKGCIEADACE